MAKKKTVSAQDVDKMTMEEIYSAWGTTREEYLAEMQKSTERRMAEVRKRIEEMQAAKSESVKVKPVVYSPAAVLKAAKKRGIVLTGSGRSYPAGGPIVILGADDRMALPGKKVARYFVPKSGPKGKVVRPGAITLAALKDAKIKFGDLPGGVKIVTSKGIKVIGVGPKGPKGVEPQGPGDIGPKGPKM